MTIVEFVRQRLDEDQAAAEATRDDSWEQGTRYHERNVVRPAGEFDWVGVTGTRYDTPPVLTAQVANTPRSLFDARAAHIARHDPARVLAQVAAMRAIVDSYERAASSDLTTPDEVGALYVCVLDLAAIWRDHPEYDPAWAVE